jgi:hypothetical protein
MTRQVRSTKYAVVIDEKVFEMWDVSKSLDCVSTSLRSYSPNSPVCAYSWQASLPVKWRTVIG